MTSFGLVAASAGGVETLRIGLVQPLVDDGHQVAITLTPTAAAWLDQLGERQRVEDLTGLPVRATPRLFNEPKPHPTSDVLVGAPMIVFRRINAAHARNPPETNTSTESAQSASN